MLVLYLWHKYYKLRHSINNETLEEQKENNLLFKFLNMDIAERLKIIKKIKNHENLTSEESRVITETEKDHKGD